MVVLVDGTVHGDGYMTSIVIFCKLCKIVHLVIVELTNQSLQKLCNGVLTLTKKAS